ncbi:hypothetical protein ABT262_47575, partial [Amycolatopsis mediterranei]
MGLRLDLYPPPEVDGAPPVHLTPVDRLCVTFAGDRCRSGPLTIGQGTMYQWIVDERPYDEMISAPLPLPAGTTLADLVAVLGILITENETLRTTFRFDGTPAQHVADCGELWVEVYRDDGTATTDAALAEELFRRLRATEFDPATDLPVRVAVVAEGNVARVAAMVYHHLAVDLTGVALLSRRIATMLAGPG